MKEPPLTIKLWGHAGDPLGWGRKLHTSSFYGKVNGFDERICLPGYGILRYTKRPKYDANEEFEGRPIKLLEMAINVKDFHNSRGYLRSIPPKN